VRWLLLEGAAVVASILLAFAIDTWWQDHQDRETERGLLRTIKTELGQNVSAIERELLYREAARRSIARLFKAASGEVDLSSEEIDKLLSDLTWWGKATFVTGALNSLLQSGNLSLIENEALARQLAGLPDRYDAMGRIELQDYETFRNIMMPFMYENVNIPQIAIHLKARPGLNEKPSYTVDYHVSRPYDHKELLKEEAFLGILVHTDWDQADALSFYIALRTELVNIIVAIELELQAHQTSVHG
jgi:hypothetical protein